MDANCPLPPQRLLRLFIITPSCWSSRTLRTMWTPSRSPRAAELAFGQIQRSRRKRRSDIRSFAIIRWRPRVFATAALLIQPLVEVVDKTILRQTRNLPITKFDDDPFIVRLFGNVHSEESAVYPAPNTLESACWGISAILAVLPILDGSHHMPSHKEQPVFHGHVNTKKRVVTPLLKFHILAENITTLRIPEFVEVLDGISDLDKI